MPQTSPENTSPKQHPFWDKHTILGTILLIIGGYLILVLPTSIATGIVTGLLRLKGEITDYLGIGMALAAPVILLFFRLIFHPDFKGMLFRGFTRTLRCCPVILIYWFLICLPDFIKGSFPQTFNLTVISLALTAGISEEVIFRGFPLSYLKRQLRAEKQIPLIVLITGGTFGLTHLSNILFGASVSASIVQWAATTCIGIFLGAVFMRGGNILVPMLLHTLHDALILSFEDADEVSAIVEQDAETGDIFLVAVCIALAAYGFFLIRKSKRKEICEMWAETWSQQNENLPEAPAQPENAIGG